MLIPIEVAMQHVYAEADDQPQGERKLASAVEIAEQYMGRKIFADTQSLTTAQTQAETDMSTSLQAVADIINNTTVKSPVLSIKAEIEQSKFEAAKRTMLGVVINPAIEIGILMIFGELYKNRENTVDGSIAELPMAAKHHLPPFRIMGV